MSHHRIEEYCIRVTVCLIIEIIAKVVGFVLLERHIWIVWVELFHKCELLTGSKVNPIHSINIPLSQLWRADLPAARSLAVVCAGGYRSSAAASILKARGQESIFNVVGGTSAWTKAGYRTDRGM